jgi:hypothetical protein
LKLKKKTFIKGSRKKIEIKSMRTKLKNIIPSIWIEWWNWKSLKLLWKDKKKKLEIQTMKTTLKNIIFGKLILKDKIENK